MTHKLVTYYFATVPCRWFFIYGGQCFWMGSAAGWRCRRPLINSGKPIITIYIYKPLNFLFITIPSI